MPTVSVFCSLMKSEHHLCKREKCTGNHITKIGFAIISHMCTFGNIDRVQPYPGTADMKMKMHKMRLSYNFSLPIENLSISYIATAGTDG